MLGENKKRFWAIALLLVVIVVFALLVSVLVAHSRKAQVLEAHRKFVAALAAHDMSSAYGLMSVDFRASHTMQEFVVDKNRFEAPNTSDWNVSAGVWGDAEVYQKNSEGWTVGLVYIYTKDKDGWRFTGRGSYLVD